MFGVSLCRLAGFTAAFGAESGFSSNSAAATTVIMDAEMISWRTMIGQEGVVPAQAEKTQKVVLVAEDTDDGSVSTEALMTMLPLAKLAFCSRACLWRLLVGLVQPLATVVDDVGLRPALGGRRRRL